VSGRRAGALLALATAIGAASGAAQSPTPGARPVCLDAARFYGLAIAADSTIWGWGVGGDGQLGRSPDTSERDARVPVLLDEMPKAVAVAAGEWHALALLPDGTVRAWGRNNEGEVGLRPGDGVLYAPNEVSGVEHAVAIAAGKESSLALLEDGTVLYWGAGTEGMPGTGTLLRRGMAGKGIYDPVKVKGLTDPVAIAAGGTFLLALERDGGVMQWGAGRRLPEAVPGLTGVVAISASHNALALRRDGTVWTWAPDAQPAKVPGLSSITAADIGTSTGHGIVRDGRVVGWGERRFGSLGTTQRGDGPAFVEKLKGARVVVAAVYQGAAMLSDGTLMGWGNFEPDRNIMSETPIRLEVPGGLPRDCRQAGTVSR
jgi:alpha-tubulin suppressor-like RCC1 family protein